MLLFTENEIVNFSTDCRKRNHAIVLNFNLKKTKLRFEVQLVVVQVSTDAVLYMDYNLQNIDLYFNMYNLTGLTIKVLWLLVWIFKLS